jgi:hypothetical protein
MRARLTPASLGRWLPVVVAALLLAVVAATGGFRAAPPVGVRAFSPGERVELRRWVLVVQSVELVDTTSYDSPAPPTFRVRLSATWTGEESTYAPGPGLIGVVVPEGPAPSADLSSTEVDGYSDGFDPDVERPLVLETTWPAGATETEPHRPSPGSVLVVLADERPSENFLFANEWSTTGPVGHVRVPVLDRRAR